MTYNIVDRFDYKFGLMSLNEIKALFSIDDDAKYDIELDSTGMPRFEGQSGGALARITLYEYMKLSLPMNYYERVYRYTWGMKTSGFTNEFRMNFYAGVSISDTYISIKISGGNTYIELWIGGSRVDYASFVTTLTAYNIYELIIGVLQSGAYELVIPMLKVGNAPAQTLDPYKHNDDLRFQNGVLWSFFNNSLANNEYVMINSMAGVSY